MTAYLYQEAAEAYRTPTSAQRGVHPIQQPPPPSLPFTSTNSTVN